MRRAAALAHCTRGTVVRPILFRLLIDRPWTFWVPDVEGVPGVGIAVVVTLVGVLGLLRILWLRGLAWTTDDKVNVAVWLGLLVAITFVAPALPQRLANWLPPEPVPPGMAPQPRQPVTSFPLFGYGTLVLTGFLVGTWVGQQRAVRRGLDPYFVFDVTFWTLVTGVAGGRLLYILQHGDIVFAGVPPGLGAKLFAAVNLSRGGLVLIGAMLGGAVGFFTLCRRRGVAPLPLLDLLTPSIFIGEGFGRLGCLLYGCCYGDATNLPWGVTFGPGSAAFDSLVERGFVLRDAPACMPLHPTQIYMSINAFLLAFVTWAYYRHRRGNGDVFALGILLYSITRFLIEFVRADELGQLGTRFTISQFLSLGLAIVALWLVWFVRRRGARDGQLTPAQPADASAQRGDNGVLQPAR
jgi:phosphatidylglycerol:prolipoprotein diacylglycerol transferase